MFNENFRLADRKEAEKESEYFTSKKERFKGKNIPLKQGSGSIPPEIEFLIDEAKRNDNEFFIADAENIKISEQKLKEEEERINNLRKANPDTKIEPMIVYGSVAAREAKIGSKIDKEPVSDFLNENKHMVLFDQLEIIGADEKEKKEICCKIEQRRKLEVLNFLDRYEGMAVSSADVIIDYVNANPMIIKYSSHKTEEAQLVESITINFIETLNKLVGDGRLKKYGFHQYQMIESETENKF